MIAFMLLLALLAFTPTVFSEDQVTLYAIRRPGTETQVFNSASVSAIGIGSDGSSTYNEYIIQTAQVVVQNGATTTSSRTAPVTVQATYIADGSGNYHFINAGNNIAATVTQSCTLNGKGGGGCQEVVIQAGSTIGSASYDGTAVAIATLTPPSPTTSNSHDNLGTPKHSNISWLFTVLCGGLMAGAVMLL